MTVLVTGAAGFIGYHVSAFLLERGETVVGLDAVTDYYDVGLKEARIARLERHGRFRLLRCDLADRDAAFAALGAVADIDRAVHLAAQAGVRHSRERPFAYVESNLVGHVTVLEFCRHLPGLRHLVYASSSSVYGGNTKLPFAVGDRTDSPVSLYAATKRANEHMSHCYSHLYGMPQTGLRLFTVYGPWGRPDMALYKFTRAILEGRPIEAFNDGDMKRDFTYVDDIVRGVVAALDNPPDAATGVPHRLYNLGNDRPEPLMRLIAVLEESLGRGAEVEFRPLQPGDVEETWADISATRRDLGFAPGTPIEVGVPRFVEWYRRYHGV
ncbi:MAG: NAD-dependent epimerase/dehydratase family protein [Defluviicoccus sp.]|nr:NAD-dependent epimerase/dehydratase family protein [Defluviicoccus sp.]MDE0384913.1 NAD-dependent epimerase/dehydratase family protein [Defluviicoccus sp.]